MKEVTLQIKPVGNHCNLSCSYCYAKPFKSEKYSVLPIELLEKIVREAFSVTDNLIVSFHGGEPTMAGLEFFKKYMIIVKRYKKKNQKIVNMIQTNATLIDNEMAKFFKDNEFVVSISLDGDEGCHNKNRYDYRKNGSFSKTIRGVQILRDNNIFPPVIATVSKNTYDFGLDNFNFFVENGFTEIKYSPVYDSNADDFSISSDQYFDYIKTIFYRWLEIKDKNIKVREIDEILMWLSNKSLCLCSNQGKCLNWISVDELGNLYPCEYLRITNPYGNIKNISLFEVFKSETYNNFKKKVLSVPEKCKHCTLYQLCHNGCPATRIKNNRLSYDGIYVYCEERKKLFNEIQKIVGGELNVK